MKILSEQEIRKIRLYVEDQRKYHPMVGLKDETVIALLDSLEAALYTIDMLRKDLKLQEHEAELLRKHIATQCIDFYTHV